MKKLMTLAALVAACAPAFTAEVTSSNTVGYQKISVRSGLTMVGMPFVATGSGNDASIQAIQPGNTQTAGGVSMMRVWNGSAYDDYYYYSAADEGIDDDGNPGWGDEDQEAVDVGIPAGQGFWVQSEAADTITTFGEVGDATTFPIFAGLTMVCNPRPFSVDIQQIVPSNTQTAGGISMIRIWNGAAYDDYYYYSAADEGIDDDGNPGWGDEDQEKVTVSIPSGAAVWVQSETTETLTFTNASN